MYFSTAAIGLLFCLMVQSNPVELIPVDAGFEDRTPLSESLKLEEHDMRLNQSFEQLFKVKGSPEIFVRRAGSLHAIFRDPHYVDSNSRSIPLVPTSTIYCIGEVTQEVLAQLGVIASGNEDQTPDPVSNQEGVRWNPIAPGMSHTKVRSIRFLDDEEYRRRRLVSFVLEVSIQ